MEINIIIERRAGDVLREMAGLEGVCISKLVHEAISDQLSIPVFPARSHSGPCALRLRQ